jgi:hypothetical protein
MQIEVIKMLAEKWVFSYGTDGIIHCAKILKDYL